MDRYDIVFTQKYMDVMIFVQVFLFVEDYTVNNREDIVTVFFDFWTFGKECAILQIDRMKVENTL